MGKEKGITNQREYIWRTKHLRVAAVVVLEVLLFTMEHGPPLGIHLNAGKTELLMAKHGSYDAAYSFFEELTNPEGPEMVRFHPDDYPHDAPLYGTRVLGTPIGHDAFVESYLDNFIADLAAQGGGDLSQAHIIAPFNDVLKGVVLAILNSNGLEPITCVSTAEV